MSIVASRPDGSPDLRRTIGLAVGYVVVFAAIAAILQRLGGNWGLHLLTIAFGCVLAGCGALIGAFVAKTIAEILFTVMRQPDRSPRDDDREVPA